MPPHRTLPVTVFFYTLYDTDKGDKLSGSPYLGHIALGPKGYHVPRTGTVQVTLFNPNGTVVKMFVVRYDLSDMPPNSRTFLRQRTLFMPNDATEHDPDSRKWLRYLIHLRFVFIFLPLRFHIFLILDSCFFSDSKVLNLAEFVYTLIYAFW